MPIFTLFSPLSSSGNWITNIIHHFGDQQFVLCCCQWWWWYVCFIFMYFNLYSFVWPIFKIIDILKFSVKVFISLLWLLIYSLIMSIFLFEALDMFLRALLKSWSANFNICIISMSVCISCFLNFLLITGHTLLLLVSSSTF